MRSPFNSGSITGSKKIGSTNLERMRISGGLPEIQDPAVHVLRYIMILAAVPDAAKKIVILPVTAEGSWKYGILFLHSTILTEADMQNFPEKISTQAWVLKG